MTLAVSANLGGASLRLSATEMTCVLSGLPVIWRLSGNQLAFWTNSMCLVSCNLYWFAL